VQIRRKPTEDELDGVRLDRFKAGMIVEVSALLGSWLVANGYAMPEMRQDETDDRTMEITFERTPDSAADRPRRRSTDR
jgi:hypothetical protein